MSETLDRLLDEKTNDFHVFGGTITLRKSESGGEGAEDERRIGGTCSTETLDRQEERVIAKGLDFGPFLSYGWFNDNHSAATSAVLGWPTNAYLKSDRWFTEGCLLKGYKPADDVWELAKSLEKSGAPRLLGFSIEGKVVQRDTNSNRIIRAIVRNVAITNCPVNPDCEWRVLAKAFAPVETIDNAVRKAMSVGYGGNTGSSPLFGGGTTDIEIHDLKRRIKQHRPGWSDFLVTRMARYLLAKERS